jgi:hypothetical protein
VTTEFGISMAYEPTRAVELTAEEHAAATAFIREILPPGQQVSAEKDIADELKRGFCAIALLGLADRLTTEGRASRDAAAISRGQVAAVKAFAIHPIAVNIYECARILACSGKSEEALVLFKEFLARASSEPPGVVRDRFTAQHDLPHLVSGAKLFLTTGIAPVT